MIFQKKSSLGDRTKFWSSTPAGARGGAGTCDAPCILGRVLDSAFIQARVRLSCSDGLIYTCVYTLIWLSNPHFHEQLPRNFSTVPQGIFLWKIIRPNSSFGAPEGSLSSGVRNAQLCLRQLGVGCQACDGCRLRGTPRTLQTPALHTPVVVRGADVARELGRSHTYDALTHTARNIPNTPKYT